MTWSLLGAWGCAAAGNSQAYSASPWRAIPDGGYCHRGKNPRRWALLPRWQQRSEDRKQRSSTSIESRRSSSRPSLRPPNGNEDEGRLNFQPWSYTLAETEDLWENQVRRLAKIQDHRERRVQGGKWIFARQNCRAKPAAEGTMPKWRSSPSARPERSPWLRAARSAT